MARRLALVLSTAVLAAGPVIAQALPGSPLAPGVVREVDIELVLAVDVSRSMDYDEQLIQRQGYVDAFRDEELINAMLGGYYGRIAVTYMEWANEYTQQQTVAWTVIDTPEDAHTFAAMMESAPYSAYRGTSISGALLAASELINNNEYEGLKRVIDISGDGSNRDGLPVGPIRDAVAQSGIVINGLPLMLRPSNGGGFGGGGGGGGRGYGFDEVQDLAAYYEEEVIAGQGAFMLPVRDVNELPGSIRQKLILEIAGNPEHWKRAELEGYEVTVVAQ